MADNLADSGARMSEHGKNIGDEAGATVKEARGAMGNAANRAKEMATEYAGKAKDYASQGYDYAAEKSKVAKETAQGYIEDNPWYAVGIALGVGVLLGMLLRGGGRSDD
jgi:ElaB/YqjD/DUF883 family membrane-anchored ribosome-binding protein